MDILVYWVGILCFVMGTIGGWALSKDRNEELHEVIKQLKLEGRSNDESRDRYILEGIQSQNLRNIVIHRMDEYDLSR